MRAYLDHASTSPLRPEGAAALVEWLGAADPARIHAEGRAARVALEDARERLATLFGTRARQVVLTSGATESAHAALHGAIERSVGRGGGRRVLVPAVEHACVRDPSQVAGPVTWIGAGTDGRVDLDQLADAIGDQVALVHCQAANHEVGTLQPLAEVVALCRDAGALVHVDAASAAGHVAIGFDDLGADLMSISAHKMGGPRGMGALLVRRGLRLAPLLAGGAQERARRAGLEDVASAVAWGAVADALAGGALAREAETAAAQCGRLRAGAVALGGVAAYGPGEAARRLPHLVCLGIEGVEPEAVLVGLDQAGVAAHSGSACAAEGLEPSPVLAAMGLPAERSLRLSVGWSTSDAEVELAMDALSRVVGRLRDLTVNPARAHLPSLPAAPRPRPGRLGPG
ncbi:MAG: cysteine desulfurase family protein [Acidimicrobiales bacterium]